MEDKTNISPIISGHLDAVAIAEFMESEYNFRHAKFQCVIDVYLLLALSSYRDTSFLVGLTLLFHPSLQLQ